MTKKGIAANKVMISLEYNETHKNAAIRHKLTREEFKRRMQSRLPVEFKNFIQSKFEGVR